MSDVYHCPDCGFEWSGKGRAPPYPFCPKCPNPMLREGPYIEDVDDGEDELQTYGGQS